MKTGRLHRKLCCGGNFCTGDQTIVSAQWDFAHAHLCCNSHGAPLSQVVERAPGSQIEVEEVIQVVHAACLPRRHNATEPGAFCLSVTNTQEVCCLKRMCTAFQSP